MPLDLTKTVNIAGFDVYDEGATEQFGMDDAEATWTLVCKWDERINLSLAITGSYTVTGVVTQVTQPMAYPDAPWLFGHSVRTEGVGTQTIGAHGMAAFQYARLTCTFKRKEDGTLDSFELGEEEYDFASEIMSFSGAEPFFKWKSDNKPLPAEVSPGLFIPVITFTKTKKMALTVPRDAFFAIAKAPLNASVYLGAPAGTLRFEGAQTVRRFSTTGTTRDYTVKFSYRPYPWDQMLRPSSGQFEALVTVNGAKPFLDRSDFTPLGLQ